MRTIFKQAVFKLPEEAVQNPLGFEQPPDTVRWKKRSNALFLLTCQGSTPNETGLPKR
jgi:hypothetical protein